MVVRRIRSDCLVLHAVGGHNALVVVLRHFERDVRRVGVCKCV